MNLTEKKSCSTDTRTTLNDTENVSRNQLYDSTETEKSQDLKNLDSEIIEKFEPKKKQSILLAESYDRLGYNSKSARVSDCGTFLEFVRSVDSSSEGASLRAPLGASDGTQNFNGDKFKLHYANFCHDRLCPMCSWRRSYKIFAQVSQIMELIGDKYIFLFLTLTVPNCEGCELSETITKLNNSWNKLSKYSLFMSTVKGFFKALEVTRNKKNGTYHPHIHAVLAVDKKYFKGKYISRNEWLAMWQRATKDYSITQVDIRRAKQKCSSNDALKAQKALSSAVAEIAKYAVKSSDYIISNNIKLTDEIVGVLTPALYHRRFCSFGGAFEDARQQLMLDDCEDGDLIHIDDKQINSELAVQIFRYGWSCGAYKLIEIETPEYLRINAITGELIE